MFGIVMLYAAFLIYFFRKRYKSISFSVGGQYLLLTGILYIASKYAGSAEGWLLLNSVQMYFAIEQILTKHTSLGILDKRYWLGIFLSMGVSLMFWAISGNIMAALIVSNLLYTVWGIVDYYVLQFRGSEVEWSDFSAIKTAMNVLRGYRMAGVLTMSLTLSFILVETFIMCTEAKQYGMLNHEPSVAWRIMMGFTSGIGYMVICATPILEKIGVVYDAFSNIDGSLLHVILDFRNVRGEEKEYEVSETAVLETCSLYKTKKDVIVDKNKLPNIIVVMNESLADLRVVGEFETNKEVMPFLDGWKSGVTKGYAHVSVYGGNTSYSEYEFLTGNTSKFFEQCPYSSKYVKSGDQLDSIVSLLNYLDYKTIAMHPYLSSGWRRPVVYKAMGFDEQYYIEDFEDRELVRRFVSDRSQYGKIYTLLEGKDSGQRLFVFDVTMQNHGGYADEDNMRKTIELSEYPGRFPWTENYLSLLHESDRALKELIAYLEKLDEPVVLVMFGDHQPRIEQEFLESLYKKKLELLTAEERSKMYMTPYYVWTNYREPIDLEKELSLNYLAPAVLEKLGVPLTGYYQYLNQLKGKYPVITEKVMHNNVDFETYRRMVYFSRCEKNRIKEIDEIFKRI